MGNRIKTIVALVLIIVVVVLGYYVYDSYFRERTRTEHIAHIIHLEDSRAGANQLVSYLSMPDLEIRMRAALAIGRSGDPQSGAMLYDLLGDSALAVAQTAAFAIGLTGQSRYADLLLADGWDLPASVTARIVEAAGRLADTATAEWNESLLAYLTHPAPEVRAAACMALFRSGAEQTGQQLVAHWQQEQDPQVKLAALYALSRMGLAVGKPVYTGSLAERDPFVRSLALRGLAAVADDEARRYLSIALNDGNQHVVAQAISGLAKLGGRESFLSLSERLEDETNPKTALALLTALEQLKEFGGVVALARQLAEQYESPYLRGDVAEYVAAVEGDRATVYIDSIVHMEPSAPLLAACARAYGSIGSTGVISRLGELFVHEDPLVRAAALGELLAVDSGNADYYINKALNDADFVVQVNAIDAIKSRKQDSYLPVLLTLIQAPEESDVDVRRSVLDAATAFITDNVRQDSTLMQIFIAGILDPDYVVRKDAAQIYDEYLDEDRWHQVPPAKTRISESRIEKALRSYHTVNPTAVIATARGDIQVELLFDVAPLTVLNFIELARHGVYDGLIFHRVITNFVAQGGDPRGDGWGGPGYAIRDEYSTEPYQRGSVGVATSGKDTGGSQFFICHTALPHLDARYTLFGSVIDGMSVVDDIVRGDVIETILIREGPQ